MMKDSEVQRSKSIKFILWLYINFDYSYTLVLSTLNKLRDQKEQVLNELNALTKLREDILIDSSLLCDDKIMEWKKEMLTMKRPKIVDIPIIDLSKYESLKDKKYLLHYILFH